MKVKFIGNPHDPQGGDDRKHCIMFEMDFFHGVVTDVAHLDAHARKKLAGNSHFEVVEPDVTADAEPKRKPGRPRKDEGTDGELPEV